MVITYLIELFANAFLLEFVILNFCEFNKNTKINITKRAIEDLNSSILSRDTMYRIEIDENYYTYYNEVPSTLKNIYNIELMNI